MRYFCASIAKKLLLSISDLAKTTKGAGTMGLTAEKVHRIRLQVLTEEAFRPYGRVLELPEVPPSKRGDIWQCWFPVGSMQLDAPLGLGIVRTSRLPQSIADMERHVSREELLFPVDKPIVQPVGLPKDLASEKAVPQVEDVQAFIIQPGQAIIMARGTWHAPAYALEHEEALYYFGVEIKPDAVGDDANPWVKFYGERVVEFVR
ncbi:MAG TPA: ureidoglycolate lyase [Limnochordia bacterium]|nr:ureidoglycolate lyase [Limnochordia bacterium]